MNRKHQRAEMVLHRERVSDSFHELLAAPKTCCARRRRTRAPRSKRPACSLRRQLAEARASAGEWEGVARERARRATAYADEYVHEHAWKSVGVAALLGALLGCCLMSGGRR